MNEKQILDNLDERGRAAAAELNKESSGRSVPAFDPDRVPTVTVLDAAGRAGRAPGRVPLYAVAAVVLALLAFATWAVVNRDDGGTVADTVTSGETRPYLAEQAPEGLPLAGVFELDSDVAGTGGQQDNPTGPLNIYGPDEDDPKLGIFVVGYPEDSDEQFMLPGDRTDPVDLQVGELSAQAFTSDLSAIRVLDVTLSPGRHLLLFGRLDDTELVKIAAATTVEGRSPEVAEGALPDTWELIGSDPSGIAAMMPMGPMLGMTPGPMRGVPLTLKSAIYSTRNQSSVATVSVSNEPMHVHILNLTAQTHTVDIRGHKAIIGSFATGDDSLPGLVIGWLEGPGEAITVSGFGVDETTLIELAESLEPVERSRWQELLEATALGDLNFASLDPRTEIGRGHFDDGTAWVLRITEPGADNSTASLQLTVAMKAGSRESASQSFGAVGSAIDADGNVIESPAQVFEQTTTLETGGRVFAYGLISDGVSRVELRTSDGAASDEGFVLAANGYTAWVAEVGAEQLTAVAFDSAGMELAESEIPLPGSVVDESQSAPEPLRPGD